MKTSAMVKTGMLTLLVAANVLASEDLNTKFDRQYIWTPVNFKTQEMSFSGFRTTRNTLRVNSTTGIGRVDYHLTFESSSLKTVEGFRANCELRSSERVNNFNKAWLTMKVNSFAKNAEIILKENNQESLITWSQVENAPEIRGAELIVLANNSLEARASRRMRYQEFEEYIGTLNEVLNRQILQQKEELIQNGEIQLELSSTVEKNFVCDLIKDQLSIRFELDAYAESAKILDHHWIGLKDFESLYQEVFSSLNKDQFSVFEAGMVVGQSMEKLKLKVDALKNDRHQKLFKSLFHIQKDKSLSLKNIRGEAFEKEFAILPEFNLKHWAKPERRLDSSMGQLIIYPGM